MNKKFWTAIFVFVCVLTITLLTFALKDDAPPPNRTFTHIELNKNADEAHMSANEFVRTIRNVLALNNKQGYWSKVRNPRVKISEDTSNPPYLRFEWSCEIVPTDYLDADVNFDRRGTLFLGQSLEVARAAVEAEINSSGKVQKMIEYYRTEYGNHSMPKGFVQEAHCASHSSGYFFVKEFFITVKRKTS